MLKKEKIKKLYLDFKYKFERFKFKYEWGFYREELIDDEELFYWFYISPDFVI